MLYLLFTVTDCTLYILLTVTDCKIQIQLVYYYSVLNVLQRYGFGSQIVAYLGSMGTLRDENQSKVLGH